MNQVFGLVIPGRPFVHGELFQAVAGTNGCKYTYTLSDVKLSDVSLVGLTLFPTASNVIPIDAGLALHVTVDGTNYSYVCSVHHGKVSNIVRTSLPRSSSSLDSTITLQFGVSLSPLTELLELDTSVFSSNCKQAEMIALDLYSYMSSFNNAPDGTNMVVPSNVFSRWVERFKKKSLIDPEFYMKHSNSLGG
eukprot:g4125.t1